MKFLTRKSSMTRKILIILLVALILIFAVTPSYYSVQATEVITEEDMPDAGNWILNSLLKQILQIFAALGDIAMGTLNHFMLGADGFTSAMLDPGNANIGNPDSWLYADDVPDDKIDFEYKDGTIDTSELIPWSGNQYDIPNFLYSPESIFANNIAALDVNFLNPNTYTPITNQGEEDESGLTPAKRAAQSSAGGILQETIANWYISFRNIAIVGLLSVLVYLGIRILISSTATDKAKYKESLQSWVVALCLVFFIHFIMSGLLMITDKFTELLSPNVTDGITVKIDTIKFRTNIIGLVRFNAQSQSMYNAAAYTILYMVLVIYTFVFTFMYFKRFLYMAFFTMIAPLVALTYPIDKAGDGKAQAFNMWFKEYTMNLVLQPVHLILYITLVSSAMNLVKQNIIYAIVAIGFLIPAEKFIKKMFGMDKAETPSGFGSFAAGAATMSGFKQVASMLTGGKGKSGSNTSNGGSTATDSTNNRVRTQERGFLDSFRGNNDNNESRELGEGSNQINGINNEDNINSLQQGGGLQSEELQIGQQRKNSNIPDFAQNEGYMPNENYSGIELPASYRMDEQQEEARAQREQQEALQQGNANNEDNLNNPNQLSDEELNRLQRQQKLDYMKKRGIRGIRKTGKIVLKGAKIATQGLGIAGGAMVGLAAGASTGDFSNTLAYMGAGAVAGRTLGKVAGNLPERGYDFARNTRDSVEDKMEEFRYNDDKDRYGVAVAAERAAIRQNERAEKQFLDNKEEQSKYEEMAGRIKASTGHEVKTEDLMKSAFDYKKAGITDEKQIETGLTMESKYGGVNGNGHENMIDIVKMTNDYGKDYILDAKKRDSLQESIKRRVNEQNQNDVWNLYTEALGMEEYGKAYAINPPAQQQAQPRTQRQTRQNPTQGQNPPRRPGRARRNS